MDLLNTVLLAWMIVFTRASALFAIFPLFSSTNFPLRVRIALAAALAILVSPSISNIVVPPKTISGLVLLFTSEVFIGLLLGFTSRLVFYAIDFAGSIISTEIGLNFVPSPDPFSQSQSTAPGFILYFLAAMLLLTFDMHHWLILAFRKTYELVPPGSAVIREALMSDIIERSSVIFLIAILLASPVLAVSFIISLVFSILNRAVPQMNVFVESFSVRVIAGLLVFGLSLLLMAQHLINYIRRLPDDLVVISQLISGS